MFYFPLFSGERETCATACLVQIDVPSFIWGLEKRESRHSQRHSGKDARPISFRHCWAAAALWLEEAGLGLSSICPTDLNNRRGCVSVLPRASSLSTLNPAAPHLPLAPTSSFPLLQAGQAQLDFMPSPPARGQGNPAGDVFDWGAKPPCLSAFELVWELLEALVSADEMGVGWGGAEEEFWKRFQRDKV